MCVTVQPMPPPLLRLRTAAGGWGQVRSEVAQLSDEALLGAVARVDAVHTKIGELHPYDLPEILVLPVEGGDPAYLAWVAAQSSEPGA